MSFTALPKRTFLNNIELANILMQDFEAAGLTAYRFERISPGTSPSDVRQGFQIFTEKPEDGLYMNFRVSGSYQFSYEPEATLSSNIEYGILSARPCDAKDTETGFFFQSPLTMYNGESDQAGGGFFNTPHVGLLKTVFNDQALSTVQVFYHDSAASFLVVVRLEIEPGLFNHMVFGKVNKGIQGGQFLATNFDRTLDDTEFNRARLYNAYYEGGDFLNDAYIKPLMGKDSLFFRHHHAGTSGWTLKAQDIATSTDGGVIVYHYPELFHHSYSPYTKISAFIPFMVFHENPDTGEQHLVGQLDDLYLVNMSDYEDSTISYGNDDYAIMTQAKLDPDYQYEHRNAGLAMKLTDTTQHTAMIRDFGAEYYDKVLITPDTVNLGVVVGDTSESITLYNTGDEAVIFESSTLEGSAAGVTMGGIPDGTAIPSFMTRDLTLFVTPDGIEDYQFKVNLSIDGETYMVLGEGEDGYIEGERALAWDYQINYDNPITESYRYKTDIIESWDGNEQRLSLIEDPDLHLYNNYTIDGQAWLDAKSKLMHWQEKPFLVMNHNIHDVLDDIPEGTLELPIVNARFSRDGFVVITSEAGSETIRIADVTNEIVTLDSPVRNAHKFALVTYGNIFHMTPNVDISHISPTAIYAQIEFVASEEDYRINIDESLDDAVRYQGLRVFDFRHNAAVEMEESYLYHEVGLRTNPAVPTRSDRAKGFTRTLTFDLDGRGEIDRFKRFMHGVRGAAESFWIVDETESVIINRETESDSQLAIMSMGYADKLISHANHLHIEFDGKVYYREVTDAVAGDSEEILILDDNILGGIPSHASVRLMYKARFNSDNFDYEFYHDGYARISKTFSVVHHNE